MFYGVLTSKWTIAFGAVALLFGGCNASNKATPPVQRGYVDLDTLVHAHPGWPSIAQYDRTLAQLDAASQHLPLQQGGGNTVTLPAFTAQSLPAPVIRWDQEQSRLIKLEQVQIARLRQRRTIARDRQLSREQLVWENQADVGYRNALEEAQTSLQQQLTEAIATNKTERLNLQLQVQSLDQLVKNWAPSKPPSPELVQKRLELAEKKQQLAKLTANQVLLVNEAQNVRTAAVASAQKVRDTIIQKQYSAEESTLLAKDERQITVAKTRMGEQINALLRRGKQFNEADVASAGSIGQETLPLQSLHVNALTRASFQATRADLLAQRARWLTFLYDDTRAAALDTAQTQHWQVTWTKSPTPNQDLTGKLTVLLKASVWKVDRSA